MVAMALRSLSEGYVIDRDKLTDAERIESSRKLGIFMEGFSSQRLSGNSDLQHKSEIGFKKN